MAANSIHEPKLLVIGELNMDLILSGVESFPELEKEKITDDFTFTLGSSSAIFAANIARLGTPVTFCGMVGRDDFGETVKQQLRDFKVDTSFIVNSEHHKTGLTVVISQNNGRAMITYPGAMEYFGLPDIPDQAFNTACHLHISSIFMQPEIKKSLFQIIEKAKKKGMTVSLDTQWDPHEQWNLNIRKLVSKLDFFLPNEDEFLAITQSETLEEGISKLQPHLAEGTVVIKQGKKGATYFTNDHIQHISGYINNKPVDAIGAGDSFNAGLIYRFLKGDSIEQCIRFGNITGAVSTTRSGGTAAIQSLKIMKEIARNKLSINEINDFTE